MSHPKDFTDLSNLGKWVSEVSEDELQLKREVRMMQDAQTANEIIDRELEVIEQMQRERVVNIHD